MHRTSTALAKELRSIRTTFRQLARAFTRLGPVLVNGAATAATEGTPARRRPRLTAKQRASLKLQGKYMGTMRGLSARKAAQVKRIRAAKGIRAAIVAAERMAG